MIRARKRSYSPPPRPFCASPTARSAATSKPGPLAADQDRVPGTRRVADAEPFQGLLLEAALGKVGACLPRLLGVPEVAAVERGGAVQQLAELAPLLAAGLDLRVLLLALELDPVAVGQQLHRLGESEPLLLLDEFDRVAADPAAEAVVELLLRVDRERWGPLLVERAEADHPRSLALEVGMGGDDLDDVGRLLHPLEAVGGDQRH